MADLFDNPMGLMGFEFVEFASPTPGLMEPIFEQMGFVHVARHRSKDVHQNAPKQQKGQQEPGLLLNQPQALPGLGLGLEWV